MSAHDPIVVAGAGQAGLQVAVSLREDGYEGPITLVGDETGLPYQRPPLSKAYMLGDMQAESLELRAAPFFADHCVELLSGVRVTAIDRLARRVTLSDGGSLDYGHLVLAVGVRNRVLACPGADLDGVFTLRTLGDAHALRERIGTIRRAVVIGAGFIGLEFAAVAAKLGIAVTVLETAPRVMMRAISAPMSAFFADKHAESGVTIRFGDSLARIVGDGRVEAVETNSGVRIEADLVLAGIGVIPNTELAAAAGLPVENGVLTDALLRTADEHVSAIGDCAAYPNPFLEGRYVRLESVQNAVDQAKCVAARLTGKPHPYAAVPWFWSDQGPLKLQIAGLALPDDESVLRGDPASGAFSVFRFRDGRLTAVESVNKPGDHMSARRILAAPPTITPADAADESFNLRAIAKALG